MENNKNTGGASATETEEKEQNNQKKNDDNQSMKKTANKAVGQVKEKAAGVLDEQKSKLTGGLSSVADSIRQVGENLRGADDENAIAQTTARYGETLAEKIESFSGYVENATIKDLAREAEDFARKQPALFIGGAFLVGILAARFLKTSAPDDQSSKRK